MHIPSVANPYTYITTLLHTFTQAVHIIYTAINIHTLTDTHAYIQKLIRTRTYVQFKRPRVGKHNKLTDQQRLQEGELTDIPKS